MHRLTIEYMNTPREQKLRIRLKKQFGNSCDRLYAGSVQDAIPDPVMGGYFVISDDAEDFEIPLEDAEIVKE